MLHPLPLGPRDNRRPCGPRILLALDKFKGTLTSQEAAAAVRYGFNRRCPTAFLSTVLVADGGDGTVAAALGAGYVRRSFEVSGALGTPVMTDVAIRGDNAIVEIASICGLQGAPSRQHRPLEATSRGVGELLLELMERGIASVVIGLGGSATTDGGAGMLCALGVRLLDSSGEAILPGGAALSTLESIDWRGLDPRIRDLEIVIASDVDSPLLGQTGAARMFGPQKGANDAAVDVLEHCLRHFVSVVARFPPPSFKALEASEVAMEPGAGAAGGLGFGARLLKARMTSGARFMLELIQLRSKLRGIDLVLTGEGRLDGQSLRGKLPIAVAQVADEERVATAAVVGQCTISRDEWSVAKLDAVWSMADIDTRTKESASISRQVLGLIGDQIAEVFASEPNSNWNDTQRTLFAAVKSRQKTSVNQE